ncbi:MAG: alpha-1,2-fucosyltransferase [Patescibacteria group bacterium]
MIIAKLQGGLGNQMFQYAFGRALAIRQGTKLKLDVTMFPAYKYHNRMIDHLNITAPFATDLEVIRFSIYRRRPEWPLKILNPLLRNPKKYVNESSFYFTPTLLETKSPCLVDGYWLCEKYFLDIEDTIRHEFTIRSPLNEFSKKMASKIRLATHPIMLHVRRADYATDYVKVHGTLSPAYYERAFSLMRERVPDASYFIFSDDPEWARTHIHPDAPTEYIGQGADFNYLDLYLMSLCEHFILANSTFSWWGAWLSKSYRNNLTIMPKYMTTKMGTRDLAHPSWTIVDDAEWSAHTHLRSSS